jgi:hypothetical protein
LRKWRTLARSWLPILSLRYIFKRQLSFFELLRPHLASKLVKSANKNIFKNKEGYQKSIDADSLSQKSYEKIEKWFLPKQIYNQTNYKSMSKNVKCFFYKRALDLN